MKVVIEHATATVTYELKTQSMEHAERFLIVAMRDHAKLLAEASRVEAYNFMIRK